MIKKAANKTAKKVFYFFYFNVSTAIRRIGFAAFWKCRELSLIKKKGIPEATGFSCSVVVPVYGVEPYIDVFLTSLMKQSVSFQDSIEVILVDDGSIDGSGEICREWASKYPETVSYIYQKNGGIASARNTGMAHAKNAWVSFPDPDDFLDFRYFERIAEALEKDALNSHVSAICCNMKHFRESTCELADDHPLRDRFNRGVRRSLLCGPNPEIYINVNTAFFRRDLIEERGVTHSEAVKPHGQDLHFTAQYLKSIVDPEILLVPGAVYLYRKRAAGTSSIDQAKNKEARYTTLLETCILDLLSDYRPGEDAVPVWLQCTVIYHVAWHIHQYLQHPDLLERVSGDVVTTYLGHLKRILTYIDRRVIEEFPFPPVNEVIRRGLIALFKEEEVTPSRVSVLNFDLKRERVRVSVLCSIGAESPTFWLNREQMEPSHDKVTRYDFFGAPMLEVRRWSLDWPGNAELYATCGKTTLEFDVDDHCVGPKLAKEIASCAGGRRQSGGLSSKKLS